MRPPIALALLFALAAVAPAQEIPDRPEKIAYPDLGWTPPDPAAHRVVRDGLASPVVYVVEDPSLPLAEVTVRFHVPDAGSPVAETAADLLLRGGAGKRSGEEIRRRLDRMGGQISVRAGREDGSASVAVLSKDLPEALGLLLDVLLEPAYREDEIARYRDEKADEWARRDDEIGAITARVFRDLVLGPDHPFAREVTPEARAAVGRDELLAWASRTFGSQPLVVTLAGQVPDRDAVLDRIFAALGREAVALNSPAAAKGPAPGPTTVRLVNRPGATQGNVRLGGPALSEDHPDWIAVSVMNYILGGSGFPSRITKRVRSDEGLAYSVGSRLDTGTRLGGTYHVGFQTRSALVPFAISLVMEEIRKMREEGATPDELSRAKQSLADRQPDGFDTPEDTASAFADLAIAGRPDDWIATYRERVLAVTAEDVLRVARAWLPDPKACVVLVVGDREALLAGDPTGAHPQKLSDFGEVVETGAE